VEKETSTFEEIVDLIIEIYDAFSRPQSGDE
jgi:hypothetical protein